MSGLGAAAIRELADRYGVRPEKSLGQNFLIDPNTARAIVTDAGIAESARVLEIGAGLGSLTVALAAAGARVTAVEFDSRLVPALGEVVEPLAGVEVIQDDAMRAGFFSEMDERMGDDWVLCANLPYNIAVPLILDALELAPGMRRCIVMVQKEVGERLVAKAGEEQYGAVSVRVAYRAAGALVRRVSPSVFWPRPKVGSVIVELRRLPEPPVVADPAVLWRLIDAGFEQRRKTMRNALRRLGLEVGSADAALSEAGLRQDVRAEDLSLADFDRLARVMPT